MQLIRKEIVQKEYPKNIYRLTVHNMSGDGEHYNSSKHFFESEKELIKVVQLLHSVWSDLDENDRFNDENIEMLINERGIDLGFDDPINKYLKYVGKDITEDSKYAHLEMMSISFFDVYGTEYLMEIQDTNFIPYPLVEIEKNRLLI